MKVAGPLDQLNKEAIMKRNGNYLFFLLLLLGLESCGQVRIETYDHYRTQQIDSRDSLFILHTVKEWGKRNWHTYVDYSRLFEMNNEQIEYFFGGVFYSPDKKKILVWIGEKKPNAETKEKYSENGELNKLCPNGKDVVYSMSALIGIRDSINQTWALYPFDQQQATCYENKEGAINVLGQYYFEEMKTHKMYRMVQSGARKGHKELEAYAYNLQDKDFWDKCWLFQKDTVGSYCLYPFQIMGYNYKGDKCTQKCAEPYSPPLVDYPEEILKLYK